MKQAVIIDIRRNAPQTWQESMSRFLAWRKAQGAAPTTLEGYRVNLSVFFKRFPTAWSEKCRDCLLTHLSQDGISPATYNNRLKTFRPFFDFATGEGAFRESPASGLKYRREAPRIVDHPADNIRKVIDSIRMDTFAGLRDRTLLLFSIDTGIRPSEALQLRVQDIDIRLLRAAIRACTSKTGRGRTVYFSEKTSSLLEKLLSVRPEEWGDDVPVFCSSFGIPWNTHSWSLQLLRYARKAGLKRLSAYDLRHQHAIEYLRNGGDVFTLQKGMGHSTLSMTERYLAISDEDLRKAHEKASPVNAMFPSQRKRMGKIKPLQNAL